MIRRPNKIQPPMLFQLSAESGKQPHPLSRQSDVFFLSEISLRLANIPYISESIFRVYHNSPIFASKKCFCPIQFICIPHRSRLSVRLSDKKERRSFFAAPLLYHFRILLGKEVPFFIFGTPRYSQMDAPTSAKERRMPRSVFSRTISPYTRRGTYSRV